MSYEITLYPFSLLSCSVLIYWELWHHVHSFFPLPCFSPSTQWWLQCPKKRSLKLSWTLPILFLVTHVQRYILELRMPLSHLWKLRHSCFSLWPPHLSFISPFSLSSPTFVLSHNDFSFLLIKHCLHCMISFPMDVFLLYPLPTKSPISTR